jgi:hypothetical protein
MGSPLRPKTGAEEEAKINEAKWDQYKADAAARGAPVSDPPPLVQPNEP